ncbi:hypothetical protein BDP27DRAFT_1220669, partial [Rhodocollybia butyracea]
SSYSYSKIKAVSSAMVFLYDWMLMLPVELDVVWSKKLRPLDILYIIQRYMPFVDTIGILFVGKDDVELYGTNRTKNVSYLVYHQWMQVLGLLLIYLCEAIVILAMRTWALWEKDIRLTVGLPIFFVGCWVPCLYTMHLFLSSQTYIPSPVPQVGCVIVAAESTFFLVWVILMVYEAGKLMYV